MSNVEEQLKPTDVLGGRLDTFLKPKQQAPCSSSLISYEEDPLNIKEAREEGWEKNATRRQEAGVHFTNFLSLSLSFPIC